jgi:hypothetical protein
MWRCLCPCWGSPKTSPQRQDATTQTTQPVETPQTAKILTTVQLSDAVGPAPPVILAPLPQRVSNPCLVDLEVMAEEDYEHV